MIMLRADTLNIENKIQACEDGCFRLNGEVM